MRRIFKIGAFCLCSLCIASCNYLDVEPNEFVTDEDVWSDVRQAEKLVNRVYSLIDNGGGNGINVAGEITAATDESKHHWENPWIWKIAQGGWNPSDNNLDFWRSRYEDIRIANQFLTNVDNIKFPENEESYWAIKIEQYVGEVRVLRAWFYYQLLERYGALPIMTEILGSEDISRLKIPRNSVDEVVDFLVTELQEAADALPKVRDNSEKGRMTMGAALALKAKVLLLNASPLFNGNTMYADVKNYDGKQLFNQVYDKKKWLLAANAAKAVLDLEEGGMPIYTLADKYHDNPVKNYAYQFYTRDYDESILFKIRANETGVDQALIPNSTTFNGNGKYSVTQEMVDSYEMVNGYPINEPGSGYQTEGTQAMTTLFDGISTVRVRSISKRFIDRDPRFYATIFFQGTVWRYEATGRQMHYAYWDNGNNDKEGWPKKGTNCESGYNVRKWCNPEMNIKPSNSVTTGRIQCFIRLSEVYLMYAEAMNEYQAKPDKEVFDAINKVRDRVSMPGLPILETDKTQKGMRARIQNEYKVEFAFENKRFFDVRRWMIAKDVLGKPVHGLNAQPTKSEMDATGITDPKNKKRGLGAFFKEVVLQDRVFEDKHYLFPIPQDEINICNEFLVQNYGW